MNSILLFVVVVALPIILAVDPTNVDPNEQLEKDDIIKDVNSRKTTWQAGRNFHQSLKKGYLKNLLGLTKRPGTSKLPTLDVEDDGFEVPKSFDARTKWAKCKSLQQVRDQGPCGSCWAVAAAATFTDRLCIASKTAFNSHLSAEELVSCCQSCGDGCNGGDDDAAWQYFVSNGLCTGGDYHSHEGCQPYTLPTCEHHVSGKRKNCSSYGDLPTPQCKHTCYNKQYKTHKFASDHHKVQSPFTLSGDVTKIQKEIFKNGPLEAGFDVYEDFLSYKTGVYQHMTGDLLGGHAVKVIGWGTQCCDDDDDDDKEGVGCGTPYWLVANSWNSDWGDQGFFKILRGSNECNFESDMSGGQPVV